MLAQKRRLKRLNLLSLLYITTSLFGLCTLTFLTLNKKIPATNLVFQREIAGVIFSTICILGIMAGKSPSRCSKMIHFKTENKLFSDKRQRHPKEEYFTIKGHHPTDGNFSSHVIQLGEKTYCAGCTGLVIGAITSLIGGAFYFFFSLRTEEMSIQLFWLGFLGVTLGLLQYNLFIENGVFHMLLNIVYVLGPLLLIISVDELKGNFFLNFFLLALIVYWIITRIMLSQFEHEKIYINSDINPDRRG